MLHYVKNNSFPNAQIKVNDCALHDDTTRCATLVHAKFHFMDTLLIVLKILHMWSFQPCSFHNTKWILWSGILVAKTKPISFWPFSPFNQDISPAKKLEPLFDFLYSGRGQRLINFSVLKSIIYRYLLSNSRANISPKPSKDTFEKSGGLITLEDKTVLLETLSLHSHEPALLKQILMCL